MKDLTKSSRGPRAMVWAAVPLCILVFGAIAFVTVGADVPDAPMIAQAGQDPSTLGVKPRPAGNVGDVDLTQEERLRRIEESLGRMKANVDKTEERGYDVKMLARELMGQMKIVVVVLFLIAVSFPLTIWLMSKRRILGLSGLDTELATTLLVVEERQPKLAGILKEIQGEIDYLHTMSVPDLKSLIQQAENYLKQNETDLASTGRKPASPKGND
jgi:hypothetical protein